MHKTSSKIVRSGTFDNREVFCGFLNAVIESSSVLCYCRICSTSKEYKIEFNTFNQIATLKANKTSYYQRGTKGTSLSSCTGGID
jgi:hypothetical protein